MGGRATHVGRLPVVAVSIAATLLAMVIVASASGRGRGHGDGATWSSNRTVTSVSATVYVSAVDCGAARDHRYAGERYGVELRGHRRRSGITIPLLDFAGVYTYCRGVTPHYTAEFVTSDAVPGTLVFTPAKVVRGKRHLRLAIAPGDPLRLSIVVGATGVQLTITDLNSGATDTITAPGIGRGGWSLGMMPLYSQLNGAPYLRGSELIIQHYTLTGGPNTMPEPTVFPPIVFESTRVNGTVPGRRHGWVYASQWLGLDSNPLADVTLLTHGNFMVVRARIRNPNAHTSIDVAHVSGSVRIKLPGTHAFVPLSSVRRIPNDSYIDASHGRVQVTLGLNHGNAETGVFYGGNFRLDQAGNGKVTASLAGGGSAGCSLASAGGSTAHAAGAALGHAASAKERAKKKKRKRKVSSLWANAHGNFTTQGSAGAAAVLGTKWLTEDECGGTYFKVVRDKIRVTAYYPTRHQVIVTAGHSYFAPGPAPVHIHIAPVAATNGRYDVQVSGFYSITVVSAVQPFYVDAAVAPQLPSGGDVPFFRDGTVNGTPRWRISFHVTPDLGNFQDWNVGVMIGGQLHVVPLRVG